MKQTHSYHTKFAVFSFVKKSLLQYWIHHGTGTRPRVEKNKGHCSAALIALRINVFTTSHLGLQSSIEATNWINKSGSGQSRIDWPATFISNVGRQQNCRWQYWDKTGFQKCQPSKEYSCPCTCHEGI